jgi:TolA-binding protein
MAIDWNKLMSVEVLSTSAVLVFSVGVAYTTLANGQEQADAQIAQLQAKQAEMQDSIADIQRDTAVLNADQKHILKMVEEQRQDIRQILKLMQEGKAENDSRTRCVQCRFWCCQRVRSERQRPV